MLYPVSRVTYVIDYALSNTNLSEHFDLLLNFLLRYEKSVRDDVKGHLIEQSLFSHIGYYSSIKKEQGKSKKPKDYIVF